jgi:S-disulfanyl-L-cysteine oxidoreductase SoxD
MCTRNARLVVAVVLAAAVVPAAGATAQMPTYGVGRTPSGEEIRAWDIAIGPRGAELPPGRGTAASGRAVYVAKCAACHGATGKEGPQDMLTGGRDTLNTAHPVKTIGSYWPYATTIYDYTYRAMPFSAPGSLMPDEVYGVTAYLLFANGIIKEDEVIDARTLPTIQMPNRSHFVRDPRPDVP